MGMEPFVAADDNAFGHLISSIPNPVANLQQAVAFKVGLAQKQAEIAQANAQAEEVSTKLSRAKMFQQDLGSVQSNPSPGNVSSLMMKYPEFSDQLKGAWDLKDKAQRDAHLTSIGQVYAPALSGDWKTASAAAHSQYDADKAAGQTTPEDDQFLQIVDAAASGDQNAQKQVLTTLGMHAAAAAGPDHFASVYGALKGGYTLGPGEVRMDDNNNVIGHSPVIRGDDGGLYSWNDVMGQGGGSTGGSPNSSAPVVAGKTVTPAMASVASTLAGSGLPAPVVAGFMGNFHVEGGYDGAQGDGGSASGIAQWHDDRAANFQRVIGKPVTEATPAEQARFVAWEMQNPQAAGMTIKQRDAILNAKNPAQAAALIDQFYERSSGNDRKLRMTAANAFAGDAGSSGSAATPTGVPRPLLPGKQQPAPTGFQWSADGTKLTPIPGGPADTSTDSLDPDTVNFYAQQILAGTPMSQLSFGMGKAAAANRRQVMEQVAKIAGAEGLSGRDQAIQLAHYKAGVSNVTNLEKQLGAVEGNERTFEQNAQQVMSISSQLPAQTGSRILNTPIQTYLRQTNDPSVAAMDVAIKTAANEYARLVTASPSGAGTLSDSARTEYQNIIQGNFPLKQKLAALNQMRIDGRNRSNALRANLQDAYKHLTDRAPELMGGGPSALPKGAKIVGTYHGHRVIEVNGKRMVEQ